jgi:hypothetical protein
MERHENLRRSAAALRGKVRSGRIYTFNLGDFRQFAPAGVQEKICAPRLRAGRFAGNSGHVSSASSGPSSGKMQWSRSTHRKFLTKIDWTSSFLDPQTAQDAIHITELAAADLLRLQSLQSQNIIFQQPT